MTSCRFCPKKFKTRLLADTHAWKTHHDMYLQYVRHLRAVRRQKPGRECKPCKLAEMHCGLCACCVGKVAPRAGGGNQPPKGYRANVRELKRKGAG